MCVYPRHVSECVRRASAALGEAGTVGALFSPQSVGVRVRLKEACERVMLANSGSHARPVEEILWRKVYYEPLTAAKKMRKVGIEIYSTDTQRIM